MLSVLEQLRSNNLFIAGDIKYILPLPVWREMNPRWMRLVVAMGHGLVSALAGHLHARGELVVLADS